MKYFRKFRNEGEYEKSENPHPNISLISSSRIKKVIFNPGGKDYFHIDGDTLIFYKYSQVSTETLVLGRGKVLDDNDILLL